MRLYLLVVRYGSEAERKRVEYVIEKFKGLVGVRRPQGAVFIVEGGRGEVGRLLEAILERVPSENVEVYKLEDADVRVEESRVVLWVRSRLRPEEAWGALSLIFAKLRGVLVSEAGNSRVYTLRPRGGVARVEVSVAPRDGGSQIRLVFEGYGSSLWRVVSMVEEELGLLGEVVRREA